MKERMENITQLFLHNLGDVNKIKKEYADKYHREFNADIFIGYALDDCKDYFGTDEVPAKVTDSKIAELALMRYKMFETQSGQPFGLKSVSFSEGSVSKSESYTTPEEAGAEIERILKPYNRFRVVSGHR